MIENKALISYLQTLENLDAASFLAAPAEPRTIRLNRLRLNEPKELLARYREQGFRFKALPFTGEGFLLHQAPYSLGRTMDFFSGKLTFQGASSQLPALALDPGPGERVLDMAASPGSKSTQMAALMENRGQLVINDVNRDRLQALNANVLRQGVMNAAVYNLPGERLGRLMPEYFDAVLLDTPCSGLGTLSSHPEIWSWWRPERLQKLTYVQRQLMVSAVKTLKQGGRLVYSTCSVAPEENEAIIDWALKHYPLELEGIEHVGMEMFDPGWRLEGQAVLERCKRVWPHKHNMEGFFVAGLRKTDRYYNHHDAPPQYNLSFVPHNDPRVVDVLAAISEAWGIDPLFWRDKRFRRTSKRLWVSSAGESYLPEERFMSGGLFFGVERRPVWKLTHHAIQTLGHRITRRRIRLSDNDFKTLTKEGRVDEKSLPRGYYALEFKGEPVMAVFKEEGYLRVRLPQELDV